MIEPATGVLLVDPDRRVRTALRTLLAAAGFTVAGEATKPSAARLMASGRPPSAAVVDPLPSLACGCALITWLTAEFGTTVVALTSDPRVLKAALGAGAA